MGDSCEIILTAGVLVPILINLPAPKEAIITNAIAEEVAELSLLKKVPHIKPKLDPTSPKSTEFKTKVR
jgi:hypothetical protein